MNSLRSWIPWVLVLVGCASDVSDGPPPVLDRAQFDLTAYPVLVRDCAFPECHSSEERFFQVFGPGRVRMNKDPMFDVFEPATEEELSFAFARASAMLTADPIEESLLLRKPLTTEEGGAPHRGTDELGRNVYVSTADPGYQALRAWALGTVVVPVLPP